MSSNPSLAERMRPKTIYELVGQKHLLGKDKPFTKMFEKKFLPSSMIFWGPPSTGKTTIARILAKNFSDSYKELSAVSAGKKDLQEAVNMSKLFAKPTILFLDEIHRFNKAQQDYLLPFVEKGVIKLIGATTENPSFEVNNALLSRSQVFTFNELEEQDIIAFLELAIKKDDLFKNKEVSKEILKQVAKSSYKDLRKALNTLETAYILNENLDKKTVEEVSQKTLSHDKDAESHYNLISALHKCMRDSDVQSSVYWTMRLIESGEDPKYIIRRMIRFASEDIGNEDINALKLAIAVKDTILFLGMPESKTALVQLAAYLAKAPKNNNAYKAVNKLAQIIKDTGNLPVPLNLRNAPTEFMKKQGYSKGYIYAHDDKVGAKNQTHLPKELQDEIFYEE